MDAITSVGTDIPVDELAVQILELSMENEEGDSGFVVEYNVSPDELPQTFIDMYACRIHSLLPFVVLFNDTWYYIK